MNNLRISAKNINIKILMNYPNSDVGMEQNIQEQQVPTLN